MSRFSILSYFLFLNLFNFYAQYWEWVSAAGGVKADRSNVVKVDKEGNLYIAGYFNYKATFGTFTVNALNYTDKSLVIAKYDSLGNCLWVKTPTIVSGNGYMTPGIFDDRVIGLDIDDSGNVYVTGVFWGTNGIVLGNYYLQDSWFSCCDNVFIAKLDKDGNFLWARWAGSWGDDQGQDIVVDSQGNVYVTGYYSACGYPDINPSEMFFENSNYNTALPSPANRKDTLLFLVKYNSNGDVLWSKSFGRAYYSGRKNVLALERDSFIYVAGGFNKIFTVENVNLVAKGDSSDVDIFILKIDLNGNLIWAKSVGSVDNERINAISYDGVGNVYVTGEFGKKLYFDSSIVINNYKKRDVFVAKIDRNGNWQWARNAGSYDGNERGNGIIARGDRIYVTGQVGQNAQFGNIALNNSSDSLNIFLAKISQDGQWIWAIEAGGKTTQDRGIGIDLWRDNIIYLSGYTKDTAHFGGHQVLTNNNSKDIFIARVRDDDVTGLHNFAVTKNFIFTAFPNPTNDVFYIHPPLDFYNKDLKIELVDISGKSIAEFKVKFHTLIKIDLTELNINNGYYLVKIWDNNDLILNTIKLIKVSN